MKLLRIAFLAYALLGIGPAPANPDPVSYAIEWKNGPNGDLSFEELQDRVIELELRKCR